MKKPIKIVVAGIGGVGGFFGGLLAKEYENSDMVEIYFLARGNHLHEIKTKGLEVVEGDTTFTAHPKLATDSAKEIGPVDYIILCTKTYDLAEVCHQITPCISNETVILPLLNGVNNTAVIKDIIPNNLVLGGCVYIVSSIVEPGKIKNAGNIQQLSFGLDGGEDKRLTQLESIFKNAHVQATLSSTISTLVWEKYIFLSSIATATSYYDCTLGELIEDPNKSKALTGLVKEVISLAHAKNVAIDKDILNITVNKFKSLPGHITSSLHRDFQNKKPHTEIEALTGYVVNEAAKINLHTPLFNTMYKQLSRVSPIIEASELVALQGDKNLVIIDASNGKSAEENYAKKHLNQALHVDLNTQLSSIKQTAADGGRHPLPTLEKFTNTLKTLGIDADSHVVIYDDKNGANAAARLWWMLKAIGHKQVQVLNGGLAEAEKHGFPTNSAIAHPKQAKPYEATEWILPTADLAEVEKHAADNDYLVIDVREPSRYRGEFEPIDKVADHIPGAVNIPFSSNLDKDGLFLSADELKEKYQNALKGIGPEHSIVHCGSGVTACHTLLALDYAGIYIPKLYVGSWSEWSNNGKTIAREVE